MKAVQRPFLRLSLLLGASLAASLLVTGCGAKGFEVAPPKNIALQPESTLPEETSEPATDSAERINQGNDPGTREEDPVFRKDSPPPETEKPDTGKPDAGQPDGQTPVVTPSPSYHLPQNTFETVRVRLFPIAKGRSGDSYLTTLNKNSLRLSNAAGMVVQEISGPYAFQKTGKVFEFNFDKKTVTVDGQPITFSDKSVLGIYPTNADEPTYVKLDMDDKRMKNSDVGADEHGDPGYRGIFSVRQMDFSKDGEIDGWGLVNYVNIEDYLRSVVPSEIGSDFHAEASKAQAIAARTFVLRHMTASRCSVKSNNCTIRDWDVDPTTNYQAYLGTGTEREAVNLSVLQTRGQYLKYNGAPIVAMYHSSSGGKTRSIQDFQCPASSSKHQECVADAIRNYPYLKSLNDPMNGPRKRFGHGVGMPQYSAQAMALAGSFAKEIVSFYYPGATLEQLPATP